jgi:hypothetical protein
VKKSLEEFAEHSAEFSKRASEVNRQLAFAGIAVIWLFKCPDGFPSIFDEKLVLPLIGLIISLGLDLLHYVAGTLMWWIFFEIKEIKYNKGLLKKNEAEDMTAPRTITIIISIFFWLKIISNIAAYVGLFNLLIPKI